MLKNVTEKKNPTKSHKNCDLKKTYKNSQKFLELKKKSVVDNYSIHSNCFCVCFCLCLFRNFLWSSSTFFRKTILKKKLRKLKKIFLSFYIVQKQKDISLPMCFLATYCKIPYLCSLYHPIHTFYELLPLVFMFSPLHIFFID